MTAARRSHRGRRAAGRWGAVLVTAAVLLPLTATGAFGRSVARLPPGVAADVVSPTPVTTATPLAPIAVRLGSLRPVAPQPGDTLTVTGSLRNQSSTPVTGLSVALRLGPALGSRGEFDQYAADPGGTLPATMQPVTTTGAVAGTRLAPGAGTTFTLRLDVDTLGLPADAWQVHELGIVATGLAGTGSVTGQLRTFLPWAPANAPGRPLPTKVAWIWPLVDRPHRGSGAAWRDDALAPELSGGGRLAQLLAAGTVAQARPPRVRHHARRQAVPVAWAVDPMLVEDAGDMAGGYQVAGGGGTKPGTGGAAARSWLGSLRSAVSGQDVVPLPYADPDVEAAARAGLGNQIGVAMTTGRGILSHELPGGTLLNTGWLPDGLADQRGVDTLFAAGVTTLVLSEAALPLLGPPPNETPSAHVLLGSDNGPEDAVLVDSGITGAVDAGAEPGGDPSLSLQQYLAETLMIQAEAPYDQRSIVVAPQRRWAPPAGYAAALLADTGRVPWIQPATLAQVAADPPYTKVQRGPLTYPATERHAELPTGYLDGVRSLQAEVDDFASILPTGTSTTHGYDDAVLRTLSSAYRTDPARESLLTADRNTVDQAMNRVRITSAGGSFVTLTSHHGSVPVTIANDLDTEVKVVLQVEANQRLTLPRAGLVTEVIPAHQQVAVDVHAAAKTSGVFPLRVRLLTPTRQPYGRSVKLNVRSTVYGTITLVITGAATALLLLAVAVRLTRRGLAARRAATAPA